MGIEGWLWREEEEEEEEGGFLERIVVAQVHVHTGRDTDSTSLAGPMLAKVSVLTRDSLSLYSWVQQVHSWKTLTF